MLRIDRKNHEKEDGNRHLRMLRTVAMKTSEQQKTFTDTVKLHASLFYYKEEQFNQLSEQHQQVAEQHEYLLKQHQQYQH